MEHSWNLYRRNKFVPQPGHSLQVRTLAKESLRKQQLEVAQKMWDTVNWPSGSEFTKA